MNIVEAYIKFNKGMIVLLSGLSGSNKTQIASYVSKDFKINKINMELYCIDKNDMTTKVSDITITDWDHIDAYKWDKLNEDIIKSREDGVIVCGPYFPTNKLKFTPDFHIHIKISKQLLIDKRHEYITKNPEKYKNLLEHLTPQLESAMINQITYPHYLKYLEESKIDKYINAKEFSIETAIEKTYDQIFDYLINKINDFLTEYDKHDHGKSINNKSNDTTYNKTKTTSSKDDDDSSNKVEEKEYDIDGIDELTSATDGPDEMNLDEIIPLGTTVNEDYINKNIINW